MTSCTYNCLMNVINIGNSIIGVSILAMPYCFRKCGILLSAVLIFTSGLLTRLACYLLLKSAIMARRRNFEFLAFHTFGTTGKLAVEISVIGFLIGVCIAFFVVIGDLGPPLAAEFLEIDNSPHLRTNVLMLIGLCVALPLGMLRKIDSLTSLSALSIGFYVFLIFKIFSEAVPNLQANEWWNKVNWWQWDGVLSCLPIFSMALSCQTQLFEFFDTLNDPSLKKMQSAINGAVCLCSMVYISVGTFGYIAFHNEVITGNILVLLTPSVITEFIKLGFIITVAVSFPLCLFPCRSSLHSLLFKQGFAHHDLIVTVIPEMRFRILTVSLVIVTIGIAIMLPNIEFVLGIIGSTIGTLICLIFPAMMFIQDSGKNTNEKRLAQVLMGIGFFILIACTYTTLQESNVRPKPVVVPNIIESVVKQTQLPFIAPNSAATEKVLLPVIPSKDQMESLNKVKEKKPPDEQVPKEQQRLEPPIPQEPEAKLKVAQVPKVKVTDPKADLDPQAYQKEDKEIQKEAVKNSPASSIAVTASKNEENMEKQEKLLQKLEEQQEEQKLILEQQKKVLEELKRHRESHEQLKKQEDEEKKSHLPEEREENQVMAKPALHEAPEKVESNSQGVQVDPDPKIHASKSLNVDTAPKAAENKEAYNLSKVIRNVENPVINVQNPQKKSLEEDLIYKSAHKDIPNKTEALKKIRQKPKVNASVLLPNLVQVSDDPHKEIPISNVKNSLEDINKREPLKREINKQESFPQNNANINAVLPKQEKIT